MDFVVDLEGAVYYHVDFLHAFNTPGVPPHVLYLSVDVSIMLLRNSNPPKLCNGGKLQVKTLYIRVIEAKMFTGVGKTETFHLPNLSNSIRLPISVPTSINYR